MATTITGQQSVILITGATGNNGQELIRQLTATGQRVRALVRKPAEATKHDGSNIEVATGDFDLPEIQHAAEKLSSVLGRKIQYVDVSISVAADGMRKSGMSDWDVQVVSDLLAYFATGAVATVTDTVPRLLGRPAISFEQFVKDHRAAFMN